MRRDTLGLQTGQVAGSAHKGRARALEFGRLNPHNHSILMPPLEMVVRISLYVEVALFGPSLVRRTKADLKRKAVGTAPFRAS